MCQLLALLQGHQRSFSFRQSFSHGSSFFRSQIKWFVLFGLVELFQVFSLCLRDDGQHSGNGFPHELSVGKTFGLNYENCLN